MTRLLTTIWRLCHRSRACKNLDRRPRQPFNIEYCVCTQLSGGSTTWWLSTKSKTPLKSKIYFRCWKIYTNCSFWNSENFSFETRVVQMHASTHATMLRRQLTFETEMKEKIIFLFVPAFDASCAMRNWCRLNCLIFRWHMKRRRRWCLMCSMARLKSSEHSWRIIKQWNKHENDGE